MATTEEARCGASAVNEVQENIGHGQRQMSRESLGGAKMSLRGLGKENR